MQEVGDHYQIDYTVLGRAAAMSLTLGIQPLTSFGLNPLKLLCFKIKETFVILPTFTLKASD